jgi:hypothetical protein
MVSDDGNGRAQKEHIESTFHIRVDTPSLSGILKTGNVAVDAASAGWLWPAVGTALLSAQPRGHLNLTGEGNRYIQLLSSKTALSVSAGLAALGLLVGGLFGLDHHMKDRAYRYLVAEPGRIYKASFPKSPPTKDPVRLFREKMRSLDGEPGTASVANPLGLLDQISGRIGPEIDVKINEFASDEKEFTLSGTTVSFASLEKIKAAVEQVKGISNVELQDLDLGAGKQVKFKLKGKL